MIKEFSGTRDPGSKAVNEFAKYGVKTSQLKAEHFQKKSLIFHCNAFHLYEAVYENVQVYIVGINYLDFEKVKSSLQSSGELRKVFQCAEKYETTSDVKALKVNENEEDIESYALNRKGFRYSRNDNVLEVVYVKENKKALDIPEYLKSVKQSKCDLIRIQMFYNILLIVQKFHRRKIKIGLLHPFLLFYNHDGLFTLDNLQVLSSLFDKFSNYQLLNYFGCFDIDHIQSLDSTFLKTDIVLLSVLLVYLFSSRIFAGEPAVHVYDQILFKIQQDFFAQNAQFSNFLEDLHTMTNHPMLANIEKFIKLTLSLSYETLPEITGYITHFETIFQGEFENEICCDCKKAIGNVFEQKDTHKFKLRVICPWCNEIRCDFCTKKKNNEKHLCNMSNESQIQLDIFKSEIEKLRKNIGNIPAIGEKKVSDDFKSSMGQIFSNIENEHTYIERKIRYEEERLNICIDYVQSLFRTTAMEKWRSMKFKDQLLSAALESKNKKMEEEKGKVCGKLEEKADDGVNVSDLIKEMKEYEGKYAAYVKRTQEFVNTVNMNMQLNQVLENIKFKSMEFCSQIQQKCITDLEEKMKAVSNRLLSSLELFPGIKDEKTSLVNEYFLSEDYTKVKYYYESFVVPQEGILYLYTTKTHEKMLLSLKDNDVISSPLDDSRYLHLKTCIVFTGGHTKSNPEIPSNLAYTICHNAKETEPDKTTRDVNMLPYMKYPREKHMMASLGHFTFLVVGGVNTPTCEEFNLVTQEWADMPKLNRARFNGCVYVHNRDYVYTFLGCSGDIYCRDIERFKIGEDRELWEVISINYISPAIKEMRNNAVKRGENSNEVILVGGVTPAKEAVKYNHVFDFTTNMLKITSKQCDAKGYEESMLLEIAEGIYYIEKD